MAKFNKNKQYGPDTKNHESEKAYRLTPEIELYNTVCTSLFDSKFYESKGEGLVRLKKLVSQNDPYFVMQLAVYAREVLNLRSIPIVLLVLLCSSTLRSKKRSPKKKAITRIVQRADELSEILSAYKNLVNDKLKPIPKAIQKGVAAAFSKFDEYQFGKYKGTGKDITLRDAMFLTHPKPKEGEWQEELFKKIADNTLEVPYTWEVEISGAKSMADKKNRWTNLVKTDKIGYMALLRNVKNLLLAGVDSDTLLYAAHRIADREQVLKSKQMPFRFLSAYREVSGVEHPEVYIFLSAFEEAVKYSVENMYTFPNDTLLIASDVSGSMGSAISLKSSIKYYDIGLLLSMLLQTKTRCYTGIFGYIFKVKMFPKENVLSSVEALRKISNEVGLATNGHTVIDWAIENNTYIDRFMIFTDCEMWDTNTISPPHATFARSWRKYKNKVNKNAKLYLFDLDGYGTTPVKVNNLDVTLISGWSENVFKTLTAIESGGKILDEIKKIRI